jgi:hypothetical protein
MDAIVAGVIQIVKTLWATHAHRNVTIVVSSILPWGATSLLEQNTKVGGNPWCESRPGMLRAVPPIHTGN